MAASKTLDGLKLHGFFGGWAEIIFFHHDFCQGVEVDWV
jgi:hypothetical protein